MGESIGQTLPLAVGVAISPIGIIASVVMLTTGRGAGNGLAFLLGWFVGLAAACWVLLQLNLGADPTTGGHPADWTSYARIALGLLLLVVAHRQWIKRPAEGEQPALPKWMDKVETINPPRAAGLALLLGAINPKNLILTMAAATAIGQTGASDPDQLIAVLSYSAIASVGAAVPLGIYLFMGDRADSMLARLKASMGRNNGVIMAVICVVIAAKLIGDGITTLSTF
ncbi:MAG: GAP family protein [Solirubrobacterales bacterium]|nr:GAP family protein [Solirubrobacterales bacterium]MCB8915150.1 GAP family protein [Thermoleophilales bacterium]